MEIELTPLVAEQEISRETLRRLRPGGNDQGRTRLRAQGAGDEEGTRATFQPLDANPSESRAITEPPLQRSQPITPCARFHDLLDLAMRPEGDKARR